MTEESLIPAIRPPELQERWTCPACGMVQTGPWLGICNPCKAIECSHESYHESDEGGEE